MGLPPAAATRTTRIADHLGTLGKVEACAADGRLSGEAVDAIVRGIATIEKRSPTALSDGDRTIYGTELRTQALAGATPTEIQKHAQTIGNTIADDQGGLPACDDRSLDTLSHHLTDRQASVVLMPSRPCWIRLQPARRSTPPAHPEPRPC